MKKKNSIVEKFVFYILFIVFLCIAEALKQGRIRHNTIINEYTNTPVCVASICVVSKLRRLQIAVASKLRRFCFGLRRVASKLRRLCFDLRRFFLDEFRFLYETMSEHKAQTKKGEFLCNIITKTCKIPIVLYNKFLISTEKYIFFVKIIEFFC